MRTWCCSIRAVFETWRSRRPSEKWACSRGCGTGKPEMVFRLPRLHGAIPRSGTRPRNGPRGSRGRHPEVSQGGRIRGSTRLAQARAAGAADGRRPFLDRGRGGGGRLPGNHPRTPARGTAGHRVRLHHAGMQHALHVLHRPHHPRRRAFAADRGDRARGRGAGRARGQGSDAARPDREPFRTARI
jgi:hypothetical protein